MMKEEVNKIGVKAYTLKLLKEKGIFKENLYISESLSSKNEFIKNLVACGFKDGDELSCRFSHPSRAIHFPRITCSSFSESYRFYKANYKTGDTIIVHNLLHAKYGGTISLINNEIVIEFIEGDWNLGYCMNADGAIFKNGVSTWYLYQKNRMVPYVDGDKVKYKEISPVSNSTAGKIFKNIAPQLHDLKNLLSGEYNSLTTLIDEGGKLQPMKLHSINPGSAKPQSIINDKVFEIKTPLDLRRWDRKAKLLISIPANIDRADALLGIISEIKKYADSVYISYGVLSHPAILMREAGLKVERKMSNYKVLKFKY